MTVPPDRMDTMYALLRKIKNLAEHPNTPEHEAATAAMKYRHLLLKYGLNEEKVKAHTAADYFISNTLKPASKLPSWYTSLAVTVAQFMGCALVKHRSYDGRYRYELSFCGRVKDTWRAIDLFMSLVTGFTHHANLQYAEYRRDYGGFVLTSPAKWKTSFLHGCVTGLYYKIQELEKASAQYTNDKALMVLKTDEADRFVADRLGIKEGKPIKRPPVARDAYRRGVDTGRRARILPEVSNQATE